MKKLFVTLVSLLSLLLVGAGTVPTDIQFPGTQPNEVAGFTSPGNCDNCHGGTTNPQYEPAFTWRGSLMANAGRDPIFWATVAVAEQDFIPNSDPNQRGGAGDLCLRCHTINAWVSGRSTPTDGSGLTSNDTDGVECEFCHLLVDPDQPLSISGTSEVQNPPFEAFDPATGEAYRGAAEFVINGNGVRLGPYTDHAAKHQALPSHFHRETAICSTCHDVSNPATGDLAPNNGAQVPLQAGSYSGVLGDIVDNKAAFNNFPADFGIVERTNSEWASSALAAFRVNDYPTLLAELRLVGGALDLAYHRAYDARSNADYEDGTPRTYTCQTCHMAASTGVGCNKNGTPVRTDLPRHDLTGSGYWTPDLIQYMDGQGTLRFGGGLTQIQKDALDAGKARAQELLSSAASLSAWQEGDLLKVKIVNLTGHKLISGYPEGRRMWINIEWLDGGNNVIGEEGGYGPIGRTVRDSQGVDHPVYSLLDPDSTAVYEIEMGLDQPWAARLVNEYGYNPSLVIDYDRMTDQPLHTLGELALSSPSTAFHSLHFVLNNVVIHENRIPPYGFRYDDARARNVLPVPANQFGNPGPGGIYNHYDERAFTVPAGATAAYVRLYYQATSWEYVQFLYLQNDGQNTFLGNEGVNLLDGWIHMGMTPPHQMSFVAVNNLTPPSSSPPGEASHQTIRAEHMRVVRNGTGGIDVTYTPACDAPDHAVYFGPLADVGTYGYSGSSCFPGSAGTLTFDPGLPGAFFLVVGYNDSAEGGYGADSAGNPRPEAVAVGSCDRNQDLSAPCDVP